MPEWGFALSYPRVHGNDSPAVVARPVATMLTSLAYREIADAKVQAFEPPVVQNPGGFRGGPVLEAESDAMLRHTRGGKPIDSFRPDAAYPDRLRGSFIYAGPIYGHFGHFMSEMVHRILPARERGLRLPYLFVSSAGFNPYPGYSDFPEFVKEILAFLEIRPQDVKVINRNTIVEKLHILEAASDLGGSPKPGYLEALRKFSTARLDAMHGATGRPAKLYVSRSALAPQGLMLGEAYFEQHLAREGFTIFRPEEMRFTPQMDHYRKAEILVFAEGSACHGTELMGTGMMQRTFIMPRRRQQVPFQHIIEPRSAAFTPIIGCVEYLGTASAHPQRGIPLAHIGASWINVEPTVAFFRKQGLADLPDLTERGYVTAAEADFQRYLEFQARPGGAWNQGFADALKAAFLRKKAGLATGVPDS